MILPYDNNKEGYEETFQKDGMFAGLEYSVYKKEKYD